MADIIVGASEATIRSDVTLGGRLVLDRADTVEISYAPVEHIQRGARIVIAGITPGAQQAANALCEFRRRLLAGDDHPSALAAAKVFASFSGPMRRNLVAMLDHIGLARWLGISTTADLWSGRGEIVHFTSVLRYPVFVAGANYNGAPPIERTPILARLLDTCLREEAEALPDAVWVLLGSKAEVGVQYLVRKGLLDPARILTGMPHPSGANAERVAYFVGRKAREALSSKTNPAAVDGTLATLRALVAALPAALASPPASYTASS